LEYSSRPKANSEPSQFKAHVWNVLSIEAHAGLDSEQALTTRPQARRGADTPAGRQPRAQIMKHYARSIDKALRGGGHKLDATIFVTEPHYEAFLSFTAADCLVQAFANMCSRLLSVFGTLFPDH